MRNFDGQGANLMRFDTTVFSPDPPASYVPLPGEVIHFDRPPSYLGWYFWPKTSAAETIDYPLDGLAVSGIIQPNNSGITFSVTSYLPYTTSFQVRYQNDTSWRVLETILTPATTPASSRPFTLNWAVGQVRIRAVDNLGNVTRDLSVNLPQ